MLRIFAAGFRVFAALRKIPGWQSLHVHDPELYALGCLMGLFKCKVVFDVHENLRYGIREKNLVKGAGLWQVPYTRLAYNQSNFIQTLALPKEVEHWSLTMLREKPVKIGAKVVSHGIYIRFQLAKVAAPNGLPNTLKLPKSGCQTAVEGKLFQ